jgi:hypothetical protein
MFEKLGKSMFQMRKKSKPRKVLHGPLGKGAEAVDRLAEGLHGYAGTKQ